MILLWKYHKLSILFIVLSIVFYGSFGYDLDRRDFPKLISLYIALFAITFQLKKVIGGKIKWILTLGIAFRLIFLFSTPNLSQDFYRFIWDGHLTLSGINPYLYTPTELIDSNSISIPNAEVLYQGMGELSASHYSNYPPINQLCFILANLIPGSSILSSIISLRILIILADIGLFFIGLKLLKYLKLPSFNIFWYILNPFIIIELTGNLHFEGVMMLLMMGSLLALSKNKYWWSATLLGLSISTKLLPLMLLPLFFGYFKSRSFKHLVLYYTIALGVVILSFIPFLSSEFLSNYSKTIGLWFANFEFNASVYYIARAIGFVISGYNQIAIIGKLLPLITISVILYLSFTKSLSQLQTLISAMLLVLSLYFLLSTTVHPWYLTSLIALTILGNFRYPIVWSLLVVLSYYAYSQPNFKENYILLGLEYSVVVYIAFREWFSTKHFSKKLTKH